LAEVLSFTASGADAVDETWRRFVPSARLERADPRSLRFEWTSIALDGLSVVAYDLEASVRSQAAPEDQIMACRVAVRDGWVGNARRDLHPGMPWLTAGEPTRARWDGRARVRALVFDRAFAEDTARQVTGDDRLVLRATDGSPHDARRAAQWEAAFRHVAGTLTLPAEGGSADGMLEAELRRHALLMTLAAFGSSYTAAAERMVQRGAAPRTLRRALAYVDAYAGTPITVDDIARAAGISTRGLQYVFRRALGVTPTEHLRAARLAGAHEELRRGTARSVTEAARRWGFSNASRFARHYREAYGRNPSQTLRS